MEEMELQANPITYSNPGEVSTLKLVVPVCTYVYVRDFGMPSPEMMS